MIERKAGPKTNWYMLEKSISENKALSWAARGLLIYLLGKPEHWKIILKDLINQTHDAARPTGRDGIYGLLNELIEVGYVKRESHRSEDGTFEGFCYSVSEDPRPENPYTADPCPADPPLVKNDLDLKSTENTSEIDASLEKQSPKQKPKPRKTELTLPDWAKSQPAGQELIGPEHPARVFASKAGIPDGWVALAWKAFADKHLTSGKTYKDWGQAFRNAVAGNWEKVWYMHEDGQWRLTTVGHGLDRVVNGGSA